AGCSRPARILIRETGKTRRLWIRGDDTRRRRWVGPGALGFRLDRSPESGGQVGLEAWRRLGAIDACRAGTQRGRRGLQLGLAGSTFFGLGQLAPLLLGVGRADRSVLRPLTPVGSTRVANVNDGGVPQLMGKQAGPAGEELGAQPLEDPLRVCRREIHAAVALF